MPSLSQTDGLVVKRLVSKKAMVYESLREGRTPKDGPPFTVVHSRLLAEARQIEYYHMGVDLSNVVSRVVVRNVDRRQTRFRKRKLKGETIT
jgi:hypothetical protein